MTDNLFDSCLCGRNFPLLCISLGIQDFPVCPYRLVLYAFLKRKLTIKFKKEKENEKI